MRTTGRTPGPWRAGAVALGLALGALPPGARFHVLLAQSGKPAMAGMAADTSSLPQSGMRAMMNVPLPFGIMIGRAGKWMVGYQYMFEKLDGLLDGANRISQAEVLTRFETTPTDMTMHMQMGMIMYAPTDAFSVMAMLPHTTMSMGELHRDGTRSTERSSGIGDLELRGLYSLYQAKDLRHRILANVGVGVPTGSVNQVDGEGIRTEYPMQTGSGTYSLLSGVAYLGQALPWSWGADVNATMRVGRNEHAYRLGNRYAPSMWVARQLSGLVSLSTGASGEFWSNIHGSDSLLDPADEPTKDSNRQGGKRLSTSVQLSVHPANGFFKDQQFLVQGETPVLQSLDGPQLKRTYTLHAAVQWEF